MLSGCATAPARVIATDSFCAVYQPVIVAPGDGDIRAPLGVRQRIAANETIHRRECRPPRRETQP